VVLRNAKGFLNKLTLEKFDTLSNQLLDVGIDTYVRCVVFGAVYVCVVLCCVACI
jgi:hypothetical protein